MKIKKKMHRNKKYLLSVSMFCIAFFSVLFLFNGCGKQDAGGLPLGEVNEPPADLPDQEFSGAADETAETENGRKDGQDAADAGINNANEELPVIGERETVNGKMQKSEAKRS